MHHSRYKYLAHIWQLVRWVTSHLGHAFAHVFASTDQSIWEKNAGAVTARACSACSGLCSSHKWCLEFARACKGLVWLARLSHLTTRGAIGKGRSSGSNDYFTPSHYQTHTSCIDDTTYGQPQLRRSNVAYRSLQHSCVHRMDEIQDSKV